MLLDLSFIYCIYYIGLIHSQSENTYLTYVISLTLFFLKAHSIEQYFHKILRKKNP